LHAFKNIEFAVHCSPRDDRNFKIFERVLKPERERVSMKEKLPEKKSEVAKNESNREHPVPSKTKETALG